MITEMNSFLQKFHSLYSRPLPDLDFMTRRTGLGHFWVMAQSGGSFTWVESFFYSPAGAAQVLPFKLASSS